MLNLLPVIAGFVPLILGADFLVNGASSLAKKLQVSNIVIGLTIVAFGTSSPELIVNIMASLSGTSDIALGNVVGSNIFNILVILGISSAIFPLSVKTSTTWVEIPLCLLSSMVMLTVANDIFLDKTGVSIISRTDGILLLLFFLIFAAYTIGLSKNSSPAEDITIKNYSLIKAVLLIIAGFVLLVLGGRLIVFFGVRFARSMDIPERIIAITIVSIGTSLPELATSVVAAKKRNVDIAIGNIVGSNIFNTFFILGASATIGPVRPSAGSNFDLLFNIGASFLLFLFIFTGRGRKLERWEGLIFLVLYGLYMAVLLLLG